MAHEHHAAEVIEGHAAHHPSEKSYLVIWFWLFVLSTSAYVVDLMPLPQKLQWCFFIIIALMKVSLIAGFFMHLRYEKLSLIYTIVLPLMLLVGLIAAIMPDGVSVLHMR